MNLSRLSIDELFTLATAAKQLAEERITEERKKDCKHPQHKDLFLTVTGNNVFFGCNKCETHFDEIAAKEIFDDLVANKVFLPF
mgnify:CR=1 FL=1